jgi:predicted DCC family thiol-disulfide oxidoreductase YuxK
MGVGAAGLSYFLPKWPYVTELYAEQGWFYPTFIYDRLHAVHLFGAPLLSPLGPVGLNFLFAGLIAAMFAVTVGLASRPSATIALTLAWYFTQLNEIWRGGDEDLLLIALLVCACGPSGQAWSLNSLRQRFLTGARELRLDVSPSPIGSTRAMQFLALQIMLIYAATGIQKIVFVGRPYFNGTAIHSFSTSWTWGTDLGGAVAGISVGGVPIVCIAIGIGTIVAELTLPIALNVRPIRRMAVTVGLLMHLGILVLMTIPPAFSLLMIFSYLAFIPGQDLEAAMSVIRRRVGRGRWQMYYDGTCPFCNATMSLLLAIDLLGFIQPIDFRSVKALPAPLSMDRLENELGLTTHPDQVYYGFAASRRVARGIPILFWSTPLLYLPGMAWIGTRGYRFIAKHRYQIVRCTPEGCELPAN